MVSALAWSVPVTEQQEQEFKRLADYVADAVVVKLGLDDSELLKLAEKMAEGGYSLQDFIWRAKGESK